MLYVVSYDLRVPERDYPALHRELEKLNAMRVLESVWLLKTDGTSSIGLRDRLQYIIDEHDGLLVCCVLDFAGHGLSSEVDQF